MSPTRNAFVRSVDRKGDLWYNLVRMHHGQPGTRLERSSTHNLQPQLENGVRNMSGQAKRPRILVIDDEPAICDIVKSTLARADYLVYTATSGSEGLRQLYTQRPDLVILDIMMPEMDGWEVCQRIRAFSDIPIIMLTALTRGTDMAQALDGGADYYLTKPFAPRALLAQAQAALRRIEWAHGKAKAAVYIDDHLALDLDKHQVLVEGQPVRLSATEYKLLDSLLRNADLVLTFEQILEQVWGKETLSRARSVHVYVSRLRQKLEKDPTAPEYILNEHGIGYRFKIQTP